MLEKTKLKNSKKRCGIYYSWLIITAFFVLFNLYGCVPPISENSGERVGKKTLQVYSGNYSQRQSKKNKNRIKREQTMVNDNNNQNEEVVSIQDFERKVNENTNLKQQQQTKILPTLKEQIDELSKNQSELKENITSIKDEIYEIKEMIFDIDSERFRPTPGKPDAQAKAVNKNLSVSAVNQVPDENINNVEKSNNSKFLISSDEEEVVKKTNAKNPNSTQIKNIQEKEKEKESIKPKPQPKKVNTKFVKATKVPLDVKEVVKTEVVNTQANEISKNSNEENNSNTVLNSGVGDFSEIINKIVKKEYNAAVKQINEKMKLTKEETIIADCHYWLGECSFNQRDYSKSIAHFRNALIGNTDKKDIAQARIAESYIRVGKTEEAKIAYQNLLRDYPKSSQTPKAKKMLQQL